MRVHAEDRDMPLGPLDMLQASYHESRTTIDRHIQDLAEGKPYPPPDLGAHDAQYFLAVARSIAPSEVTTESLRDDILGFCARNAFRLITAGALPTVIVDATRTQATLFHHLVVATAISRMAYEALDEQQVSFQTRVAYACRDGLEEYATTHFSEAAAREVWIGHKLFCGKNAYPLTLPLLTPSEAEIAIANMDKPAHASSAGGKPRWSVYELAHENLGLTKSEFKNCIEELTEGKDTTLSRWTFEQNQLLLTLAFSANREPGLNAFRADVLNWLIKDQMDAADAGVMKRWLYSANRIEATMLHGLICVFSTLRGALETLDLTVVKKRTSASGPCCKALVTYIKAHFSPSDAQKLFKVFTLDPPDEATSALQNLDKHNQVYLFEGTVYSATAAEVAAVRCGISKKELKSLIRAGTECTTKRLPLHHRKLQFAIYLARRAHDLFPFKASIRDDILCSASKKHAELEDDVLPWHLLDANRSQATLFHALVCLITITRIGVDQPIENAVEHAKYLCRYRDAIQAYTAVHFTAEAEGTVRKLMHSEDEPIDL
ncbi:hypothetical protein JCM10021v2_000051 [Rhodotorula toruloides]